MKIYRTWKCICGERNRKILRNFISRIYHEVGSDMKIIKKSTASLWRATNMKVKKKQSKKAEKSEKRDKNGGKKRKLKKRKEKSRELSVVFGYVGIIEIWNAHSPFRTWSHCFFSDVTHSAGSLRWWKEQWPSDLSPATRSQLTTIPRNHFAGPLPSHCTATHQRTAHKPATMYNSKPHSGHADTRMSLCHIPLWILMFPGETFPPRCSDRALFFALKKSSKRWQEIIVAASALCNKILPFLIHFFDYQNFKFFKIWKIFCYFFN